MAQLDTTASAEPLPPLGRTAASGAAWLGAAQLLRVGSTILSTAIIARILTPDDYGVLAMVGPILALVGMFQDLGLSAAAIQARSITHRQSNALFWMNLLASGGLAAALVFLAPAVGWFYGDTRAGYVAALSGFGLLISGAGLQHSALLNREMKFGRLGIAEMVGLIVSSVTAIVCAFWLRSYWALVFGALAGSLAQTLLYWASSPFRPTRPSLRGSGELARLGGHITGFGLMNFCIRNLDDVLVARYAGATAAGLYDRSYRLMMMPLQNINGPINRLLQPLLARLRDEPDRYRRTFNLAIRGTMLAITPGVAVITLMSDRFMPWLLGPGWTKAGPIFFWLGLTGLIQPIANLTGLLFVTTGRAKAMMYWGALSAVITILAYAIGITGGALGISQALFWSMLIRIPILFFWSSHRTSVRVRDLYSAQIEPLIGACAVALLFRIWGGSMPFPFVLACSIALAYPAAVLTSCLVRQGRQATIDLFRLLWTHFISKAIVDGIASPAGIDL